LKDAVLTRGGENWETIAALVPGRTKRQCSGRWYTIVGTNIDPTTARAGRWTVDEDKKLKDAVQTHGGENWETIAALVTGRTKRQCSSRWQTISDTNIDPTPARAGRWTADEDGKLKDAVQTHGGKDWAAIAALVPGRTKSQCWSRWNVTLDPNIDRAGGRTGK
jgi:myb proto-oncogene protein